MKNKINKIEELFNNLSEASPENLEEIMSESISLFEEILTKLNSDDEKEKEEARKTAEALKDSLEQQSARALEAANMNMHELESFMANPENFSEEEWKSLETAKKELDGYYQHAVQKGLVIPSEKKAKKKKASTYWVRS